MDQVTNIKECTPRNYFDAPAFSHRAVMKWLTDRGAKGIINTRGVAYIVGCSMRTVKDAERRGDLGKPIDKCTYELEHVARWLMNNPRFIAQDRPNWTVDEKMLSDIRNILLAKHQTLIARFNNDVEELVQEIAYRLMRTKKTNVSASSAIYSIIGQIIRDENKRVQTVSIATIK